jgi:hypothetical protein
MCKLADAWALWQHYAPLDNKPAIPPGSVRSPRYRGVIERWLRDFVCTATYQEALDATKLVSGDPPVVFSTFEEDRNSRFPARTPANTCRKVVGLDEEPTPEAHALLRYDKAEVGPARVPTAFDAGTHVHFLPPPAGANHGTTKNLTTADGSNGVREVVVKPFPVSMLRQPEFIEAG